MPPKVKKLTKKELKEIEELKRKEEEEKRRKEEEEREKIRKEEEEKRRKEEDRLAKLEKERLAEENSKLENWRQVIKQAREMEHRKIAKDKEWEKFKICSIIPDGADESQITTFITQYKESAKVKTKRMEQLQIEKSLNLIQHSENIVSNITEEYMRAVANEEQEDQKRLREYINQIRTITFYKFEEITATLALFAEDMADQKAKEIEDTKEQKESPTKQFKQDNKHQNEVYKVYPPSHDFRFGLWINPNQKGGYRHKPIEFADTTSNIDIGIACEVPQRFLAFMLIMRANWTSFDFISNPDVYSKDIITGGVLLIDCLDYLPPKKNGMGWSLKQDYEIREAIKKQYYPSLEQQQQNNYQGVNPVRVIYQLPSYLLIYPEDTLKVALYDDYNKTWNSDLIQEVKWNDQEKKQITFSTLRMSPFAYVQDRCTDYPYISWKLRCIASDRAYIDIEGKRDTFKFEIGPGWAKLRKRDEKELSHLVDRKLASGRLLYEIQKCGINLLPMQQDAITAGIVQKEIKAENLGIADIVMAVRSFFVKSSRFSFQLKSNKILLRVRENPNYYDYFDEDQEKDWKSIMWFPNKVQAVKSRDSHATCNEIMLDDTLAHVNMLVLLEQHGLTNKQSLDRMRETQSIVFQDTLSRFLRLTHVLTFTAGKPAK